MLIADPKTIIWGLFKSKYVAPASLWLVRWGHVIVKLAPGT
jgi:hypothetical protein